jgi:PAS domain-containing protein
MQTLTKTFAELSIGLAVFDGNRQLVLFNPALTDLTGLRVDFLSCRPSLMDFFDRLRDNQVLPEPKSYATWRSQISGIIDSTEHGHYSESWSLPTGLTYRVTGKPHADGSVAFLIEDISDEMSLTRRYRTQLDMRQSALDHISEAVAVISPGGVVVFSNEAFSSVIGKRPDESLTEIRANTLLDACRKQFPHPSFWEEALDLVEHRKDARQLETVMACGAVCRLERLRGRFFFVGIRESRRETARARVLSA